jgi:HSP90 family molecular chaperone
MAKAVMSIDPRLVSLVGRKLYSSHPIPIVTRELLQNSVDACRRKGIEPDIKIEIFHNDDY